MKKSRRFRMTCPYCWKQFVAKLGKGKKGKKIVRVSEKKAMTVECPGCHKLILLKSYTSPKPSSVRPRLPEESKTSTLLYRRRRC